MFSLGGSVLRADLRGVVEQAFRASQLYIGPQILTPLPVMNKSGQYPVIQINGGNLLRDDAKRRGAAANYARVNRSFNRDTYTAIEYGIEAIVDDSNSQDVSRFFDLEEVETRRAYGQIQLAHERRVKSKVFDPTTFSAITSSTPYTGANLASFDLGLDIDSAKQQIQSRGEDTSNLTVVMSLNNFIRARASTRIQNRIRGTMSTDSQLVLSQQALADALEVGQVLVGRGVYDQSKQGASASSLAPIWTDDQIWIGNVSNANGPEQFFGGGCGFTLFWEQDADIFQVESYREENIRSTIIRARQFTDEKIVLPTAGEILFTQYA